MGNFGELYREKLFTAAEIAKRAQSGWNIGMDATTSQTPAIIDAVTQRARAGEIEGIKVHMMLEVFPYELYTDSSLDGKINGVSWFSSSLARKAVNSGYADFVPSYYRDSPSLMRQYYDFDAYCASVSPMDEQGYFTLGAVSSYSEAMIEKSKRIFIEVNEFQPRALNGLKLHVSQVDGIVENSQPLAVLPPTKIDEVSSTIGSYIAELIPDGACIQLGIGAIPDATGLALKSKHDLGIHTEMFTDSMVELIACGAVNNSKKQLYPGVSVTTFAFGSKRIYDYIDNNPDIIFKPVDYVNDPAVIAQNDNMISINAALEVDFWGQVCAESIGTKHLSGSGGQIDYVRGATQSKGGKSFIAFSSTAKDGAISKIKSTLTDGAVCTTSKNDVDYIVTEYGVAHLRGQSLASRTRQLIAIAHPNFRDELRFEAKKRGIII